MTADPWDDDRIGLPRPGATPAVLPRRPGADVPEPAEPELRPGDTDLGRPPQVPASAAPLTDDDRRRLREADEEQALRDLAEAEEMVASDPAVMRWAGWFAHPLAAAFLLGSVGVLGLFLYSQVLNVLSSLQSVQPAWVQYPGYAALGLLA